MIRHAPTALLGGLLALASALILWPGRDAQSAYRAPLRTAHAAVATPNAVASQAGVEILRKGGNAVDAACAAAFALGVVQPHGSGLGGGGFALIYRKASKTIEVLDFRETAPAKATRDMYVDDLAGGKVHPTRSVDGALAIGTPGELAGCAEAIQKHGKLKLEKVLEPARRLAAKGFVAGPALARAVAGVTRAAPPGPAGLDLLLSPGGQPLTEAVVVKRKDLARTLATLQKKGAADFYRGAIAREIVAAVQAHGGILTLEDLAAYRVQPRTAVETTYRGRRVVSMPPPSSGGIAIVETLGILEEARPELASLGAGSSAYFHLLAEALKHSFADRARHLGDPDFWPVPTARLTSRVYQQELAKRIGQRPLADVQKYGSPAQAPAPTAPLKDAGTSHISVIDAEGNAVCLTTTINTGFGARFVAGKTGILLNNEMDDFSADPGAPNAYGLIGSDANAIAPKKRPLSSMAPTLVLSGSDGTVEIAAGGAGGPAIISGALQTLINIIDFGMDAEAAVSAPRLHAQWSPNELTLEPEIPVDVWTALGKRGHKVVAASLKSTIQVIRRLPDGRLESASDPRNFGAPAGY